MERPVDPQYQQSTAENAFHPPRQTPPTSSPWYFTREQITHTPSIMASIASDRELWYRYQCAELMQTIGNKLGLLQIAINTAILYMHRFYQFHSFSRFHRHTMAPVFVFLAAKVEEQPRRLEHVVKTTYKLINPNDPPLTPESEKYLEEMQNLVTHENVLLQTLAFDLRVEHPHTHVIKCCHLIKAEKDLSHAAYSLASCALQCTTVCIQYRPVVVACMCIYVASKWSDVKIPLSIQGKPWYLYMDPSLTEGLIQQVANDFLDVVDKYTERVRQKIWAQVLGQGRSPFSSVTATAGAGVVASSTAGTSGVPPIAKPEATGSHVVTGSVTVTQATTAHVTGEVHHGPNGSGLGSSSSETSHNTTGSKVLPQAVSTVPAHPVRPPTAPRPPSAVVAPPPPAGHPPPAPVPPPPPLPAVSSSDARTSLPGTSRNHDRDREQRPSMDNQRRPNSGVTSQPQREDLKRARDTEAAAHSSRYPVVGANGSVNTADSTKSSDQLDGQNKRRKRDDTSGIPEHTMRT